MTYLPIETVAPSMRWAHVLSFQFFSGEGGGRKGSLIVFVCLIYPDLFGSLFLGPHLILYRRLLIGLILKLRRHMSVIMFHLFG